MAIGVSFVSLFLPPHTVLTVGTTDSSTTTDGSEVGVCVSSAFSAFSASTASTASAAWVLSGPCAPLYGAFRRRAVVGCLPALALTLSSTREKTYRPLVLRHLTTFV
ncbi:hypothetical protein B0J11DRAFT_258566 [Dendryphion nanum]|uniref:Secreted protein n=1 Tax=Dendryphion nanum TaxID=256645 RepID=A0A9P9E4Y2_9PLEO|nr:hypothetical protein B0J11DRAFT_258566 [Dendryphion nanum]